VILTDTDASGTFRRVETVFGDRFKLERLVAANAERVLFAAVDRLLNRRVSLRANLHPNEPTRAWFLREAEALAQLDHPAIRHVYDAGIREDIAFRVGNWVDGESLLEAAQRGPRLLPMLHTLARDLLSALDHAHMNGIIVRRVVPASLVIGPTGRSVMTDVRFCSWTLASLPPGLVPSGQAYIAPELRQTHSAGDPTSDVYTAGALLYFAITGQEPTLDPTLLRRPSEIRPTVTRTLERVVLRALRPNPDERYLTAAEMLEDFTSEAGMVETAAVSLTSVGALAMTEDKARWEKRLRRALGDDYELLSTLGSGGFGTVYKVRDLHLERIVALKVLHPSLTQDPAVVERFRREAQLAARLTHPHIANVFDIAGRSGLIWYTMEYVDGPSLAQLVERDGPLPVPRVLEILQEALWALHDAHAAGVVHRDIKPENMLLAPDGGLRITDFGLALALRGQGRFGGATSQSGTPQFASPEQLLGERVDQRSDLYSVAAVAYFSLLGRPPFSGRTPEQILALQTTDQIPELRAERPDVTPELEAVLAKALRNNVAERFASADEFLEALEETAGKRRRAPEWAEAAARWLGLPT
jgi:serine/threonine-protein kinase